MSLRAAISRTLKRAETVAQQSPSTSTSGAKANWNCIQLRGLPASVIPQDIWRLIRQANVENVSGVKLDYNRFTPLGRAYVVLTHARFLDSVLPIFRRLSLGYSQLTAIPCDSPESLRMRTRGKKGREEAERRGIVQGTGVAAGLHVQGCDVLITGMPRGTSKEVVERYLKKNNLVGQREDGTADCEVLMALSYDGGNANARFLVRLKTVTEAHAIVRRLHMTYIRPWSGSKGPAPSLVHAKVLY